MKLLIGTGNPAKFDRYSNIIKGNLSKDLEIFSLKSFEEKPVVVEDGLTALENAIKKATAYSNFFDIPTLSIDEALFIEGLPDNKQPNVRVRRYDSEVDLSDDELLKKFTNLALTFEGERREALWIFAICLSLPNSTFFTDEVIVKDILMPEPTLPIVKGYPMSSILFNDKIGKTQNHFVKEDWKLYLSDLEQCVVNLLNKNLYG